MPPDPLAAAWSFGSRRGTGSGRGASGRPAQGGPPPAASWPLFVLKAVEGKDNGKDKGSEGNGQDGKGKDIEGEDGKGDRGYYGHGERYRVRPGGLGFPEVWAPPRWARGARRERARRRAPARGGCRSLVVDGLGGAPGNPVSGGSQPGL